MTTKLIAADACQQSAVRENHQEILELIEAYAEARHIGGCHAYNAKTAEARAKVIARLAASAGSEPVARVSWTEDQWLDLAQSHANADWSSDQPDGYLNAVKALCNDFASHPSPPEGMVGGWMPIETAPKYTEHGVRQHLMLGYAPDEIHEDGFVSQGYWVEAEEDAPDNMGHDGGWVDVHFDFFRCGRSFGAEAYRSAGTQPSHWMPLPPPPTTSAGGGKGE